VHALSYRLHPSVLDDLGLVDALKTECDRVARHAELRPNIDHEATVFVLQHAIEAVTHAAAFYRPADLTRERVLAALAELVTRELLGEAHPP